MTRIITDQKVEEIKGEKIVLAGGCFDILHPAHIEFLTKAKARGDTLVILLESDKNIQRLKGMGRPINTQKIRAEKLSNLDLIEYIILLSSNHSSGYYYNLVKMVHPAIIAVTKGDPLIEVKKDQAKLVHGKVVEIMDRDKRYSSSKLMHQNEI